MVEDTRNHPYRGLGDEAFWSRSVAAGRVDNLVVDPPLFTSTDRVASAGSCFAANIIPRLEAAGITYVREEPTHPAFVHYPEHLGYATFSAAYGNVYTVRQFRQLMQRAMGAFSPSDDREREEDGIVDLFRPGMRFRASSDAEFDALTRQHLDAVLRAVENATVFVFTLGLTEAWESTQDGAVYPVVPGSIAGRFDPSRFEFRNFSYEDVLLDLRDVWSLLRSINPELRMVVTVSPVPLVATASGQHVLLATSYSKSVLRAAAGMLASETPGVRYFPAYEIVTGPQAPSEYLEPDARSVSADGVDAVMRLMFAGMNDVRAGVAEPAGRSSFRMSISESIVEAECEEAFLDRSGKETE